MKITFVRIIAMAALAVPSAASAGHSGLTVPPTETFLLGGDQTRPMTVTGKNVGETELTILSRRGPVETTITNVSPGMTFTHVFPVGETALVRNRSATAAARVSVDFTGSASSLSMSYASPEKN